MSAPLKQRKKLEKLRHSPTKIPQKNLFLFFPKAKPNQKGEMGKIAPTWSFSAAKAKNLAGWLNVRCHMGGEASPDGLRDDHKGEHGGTPREAAQHAVQDALQPPPTPPARYRLRRSGKRLPSGKAMIARAAGDGMAPHNGHEPRLGHQLLVSVDDIRQVLHLPAVEAAKELSMSARTLRRYCRKFGIRRWPYRKLGLFFAEVRKRETPQSG